MRGRSGVVIAACALALVFMASTAAAAAQPWDPGPNDPPKNPFLVDSPWAQGHRSGASQASTPLRGPENGNVEVTKRNFLEDAGTTRNFFGPVPQTSPWMALSSKKYSDAPDSRAQWAVSLTDIYKYEVDGDTTRFVDNEQIRGDFFSVLYNFFVLDGDRVVVPTPQGTNRTGNRACHTTRPALLEFGDTASIDSPITCVKKFEFTDAVIAQCRQANGAPVDPTRRAATAVFTGVTHSGDVLATVQIKSGVAGADDHTYLAVIDNSLSALRTCQFVDDSETSNQLSVERITSTRSGIYLATNSAIVKMEFNSATNTLHRRWERTVPLRRRTGTTPTLVGFGQSDKFVVIVDAPCAVVSPTSGAIECSADTSPAKLIAVRRDNWNPEVIQFELPAGIRTVENSPSARGNDIVIANYGGYHPDPTAKGVAMVSWNPTTDSFQLGWSNTTVQMNGVTTISSGSNLVYSSGVDGAGNVRLYGLRLKTDASGPGGAVVVDVQVAPASQSATAFDAGNNTIVNDDRSVSWSSGVGLVRVRQR